MGNLGQFQISGTLLASSVSHREQLFLLNHHRCQQTFDDPTAILYLIPSTITSLECQIEPIEGPIYCLSGVVKVWSVLLFLLREQHEENIHFILPKLLSIFDTNIYHYIFVFVGISYDVVTNVLEFPRVSKFSELPRERSFQKMT
jgi:hypothetical protein